MPALGYIPSAQFYFPRSYIFGLRIRHDGSAPVWTLGHVEFIISGAPDALCKADFDPDFMAWSSNKRSLDHLVISATYEYPPVPTVFDLPYYLYYDVPIGETRGCITLDVTYGAHYTVRSLDVAPSGYWLPYPMP